MQHSRIRLACLVMSSGLLLGGIGPVFGHGMVPRDAPVDRLVANLEKHLADHPDDAESLYRLGRIHLLALETKTEFVRVWNPDAELPRPAEGSWAHDDWGDKPPKIATPGQLRHHLSEAISRLNKAIELRPTEAKYRLTLACALEAGRDMIDQVDVWPLAPVAGALDPQDDWEGSRIDWYRRTFSAAANDAGKFDELVRIMREIGSARDPIISLAYEHRDDPDYKELAAKLRRIDWVDSMEDQYFTAMCHALPGNSRETKKPIWGAMTD